MKILQIVHGFPPASIGGTEIYTYNLSQQLARRHKVFVFHRRNDLHAKEYTVDHNSLNKLEIFGINNTFRKYASFEMTYKNDTIAEKLAQVLDQIKPDIVHIQHLLYLSARIVYEVKRRNIPIIFTLHDYWLICPQGQLLKSDMNVCDGGKANLECIDCVLHHLTIKRHIFNAYYFLKKYIPADMFQLIKNIYLRNCKSCLLINDRAIKLIDERVVYIKDICSKVDRFISPSKFLCDKFIDFGIPQDKIAFLTYGFNLNNFRDFQKTVSDRLRFGFIGNILPAKGVHILIESFNKVEKDGVELRIYGRQASYKGLLGNYLNRIKKQVKNKNIRFMGGFDNKDIAKIFAEIDILVVPSIWYENSPLVIQEAFATKTPVIASKIGGIPELIDDGINGILFTPDNPDDLYRKINLIIESPSLRKKIRHDIKPPKSIEENAREVEGIYGKLITRSNPPACTQVQDKLRLLP